eukprot:TRINITY_DN5675_c0_g2_i4.p1 TRINITY_DN5675_c0_g2~~TRINITY_DN5675_c0_g2_i4.p1  ORF type:complete len:556 (+),score=160.92 TRINITY_DN5675_c0_g2_i4:241-1908(+)
MTVLTGRDSSNIIEDTTLSKIEKAARVANTPIRYSTTEVLQLIHQHLVSAGLTKTANLLLDEAKVPPLLTDSKPLPSLDHPPSTPTTTTENLVTPRKRIRSAVDGTTPPAEEEKCFTLQTILEQFLLDQHQKCAHPISVLPEFSLLNKHQCPVPLKSAFKEAAPFNLSSRLFARQRLGGGGGRGGNRLFRRFLYSRFKHTKTFKESDEQFMSAQFVSNEKLLVGASNGVIVEFNLDKEDVNLCEASDQGIWKLNASNDFRFVISSTGGPNETKLWDVKSMTVPKNTFSAVSAQFSNLSNNYIVGNQGQGQLMIYDTETGKVISNLTDNLPTDIEQLKPLIPTFSPDDSLVLCDGILWDYRSSRMVHRFDKFATHATEQFNKSNGLDVIINSEIWDMRTFKLQRTCQALDQLELKFNRQNDVMFGIMFSPKTAPGQPNNIGRSFRTIDATDYDLITKVNIHTSGDIFDISVKPNDTSIATVEQEESLSVVRIWDIGRTPALDDDDDEEEEEDDDDDEDDGSLGSLDMIDDDEEGDDGEDDEEVDMGEEDDDQMESD